MNRFLTVASSALIAAGLAILPVASFAQTGGDAAKTPAQAAPASTSVQTSAAVKAPVVTQDKVQPTKAASATTAKSDVKPPMAGKTETHAAKATVHHTVAKAPMKDSIGKS